jgi:hypothetical protein
MTKKKSDDKQGLIQIFVGPAGIGRMGFRAYGKDEIIDRGDGDDSDTHRTPGKALAAFGKQLDATLVKRGWHFYFDEVE